MKNPVFTYRYELMLSLLTLAMLALMEQSHPYFFLQDDNRTYHLPYYVHNLKALARGELPFFNFNQYLGTPVSFFSAPFYPINYVAMLLSSLFLGHYFGTMEIIAAIHLVAAALGYYRFSKELGLEDASGCFGAVAWAFSPFVITIGNSWIHTLGYAAWLPWMLAFSIRQMYKFNLKNSILLLLVRLLAILLGYPQWFLYTIVFELILLSAFYGTFGKFQKVRPGVLVFRYVANYLALAVVSLPYLSQLFHELSLSYARNKVLSWGEYTLYSYSLEEWLHGIFFPFSDAGMHHVGELDFVSHIGYLTLIGAFYAMLHCRDREQGRKIVVFSLMALMSLLWSADILFTKLFYYIPFFNKMRFPFKLQFFTSFFLVTCAAFGFDVARRNIMQRFGTGWKRVQLIVILAQAVNFMVLYTLLPQRMLSNHLDLPPFEEPLKKMFSSGRIVSAGPDVVWDGERVVPGNSVPTLGYNFAMLWGLNHFGGYEALLSERNLAASMSLINNSIFNVATGTALDFASDVPLAYLRKWGVQWYVVNNQIPVKGAYGVRLVYSDKFRNVLFDSAARPLVYWADTLKSTVLEFCFRSNSVEISTRRGDEGVLVINVLYNAFFNAYLDGRKVPVTETEDGQMSVVIPSGRHKVSLEYRDQSFIKGALVALTFLLSAAVLWSVRTFRQRGGK